MRGQISSACRDGAAWRSFLPVGASCSDPCTFLYRDGLISGNVGELVDLAAGPLHLDCVCPFFVGQAEGHGQFTLREITRSALDHLPLLILSRGHAYDSANAITVRPGTFQLDSQAVIRSALVVEEKSTAAVGGDQQVEGAVIVDVGVGSAPRDFWIRENTAHLLRDFLELASTEISK